MELANGIPMAAAGAGLTVTPAGVTGAPEGLAFAGVAISGHGLALTSVASIQAAQNFQKSTDEFAAESGGGTSSATPGTVTPKTTVKSNVQANKAAGDAFAKKATDKEKLISTNVENEITIKSNGPSGKRTRMDIASTDSTDKLKLTEAKASPTASLTPNQTVVHPELQTHGGTVVGKGKGAYFGGTVIPPTKVDVVRGP